MFGVIIRLEIVHFNVTFTKVLFGMGYSMSSTYSPNLRRSFVVNGVLIILFNLPSSQFKKNALVLRGQIENYNNHSFFPSYLHHII